MVRTIAYNSFLKKMMKWVKVLQIGTTIVLLLLALIQNIVTIYLGGNPIKVSSYIIILLIQCIFTLLMLKVMLVNLHRTEAWLIWLGSWWLGNVIMSGGITFTPSLLGVPLMISSFILILATHS